MWCAPVAIQIKWVTSISSPRPNTSSQEFSVFKTTFSSMPLSSVVDGASFLSWLETQGIPYEIDEDVEVVSTPSQSGSDVSVIVKNTPLGTVAVTGGLFECYEDLEDPSLWQGNSEDPESQEQGRIDMLQLANHIIPGHGKMFQVPENYKKHLRVVMYSEEHYEQTIGNTTTSSHQREYVVIEKDD